jgi:hypothetical protein
MDNLSEPKIKNKYETKKPLNIKKLETKKYLDKFLNKDFLKDYFKNSEKRTKN